jgi:hypothetical protein
MVAGRVAWQALALLLGASWPRPALGAEPAFVEASLDLRLEAGAPCVDVGKLIADVERRLGRRVFVTGDEAEIQLRVVGQGATEGPPALELQVSAQGRQLGTRLVELPSGECGKDREELTLIVSMLVDMPRAELESRLAEPEPATAEPEPEPELEPEPSPSPPARANDDFRQDLASPDWPPPKPRRPHVPRWTTALGASAGPSGGVSPAVSLEVGVSVRFTPPRAPGLGLGAGVRAWPLESSTESARGAAIRGLVGELGVAQALARWGRGLTLLGTLALEGGFLSAEARGFDINDSGREWLAAARGGARVEADLTPALFVSLDLCGRALLVRPNFVALDGGSQQQLFQPDPFGWSAAAGAGVRF